MSAYGTRPGLNFSLLVSFLICLSVPALAASTTGVVVFEGGFPVDQWSWVTTADGKTYPAIEGTRNLTEPGQPILPVQDLMLLIPAGRKVADAWVEPLATRTEKMPVSPALATPHITDGGEMVSTNRLQPANGQFPSFWGEFSGTHTWRGYQLLTLNVYPARIFTSSSGQKLECLEDYAVRVLYSDGVEERFTVQRERFIPGESESNAKILRSLVDNPNAVMGYARNNGVVVPEESSKSFNPNRTPSLSGSAVQYVIITNEEMEAEFQRLADFKTGLGIPTIVITHEFITSYYRNGADIQETIRLFLQDAYGKWGTEYVLLAGDTDVLPARYVDNTYYPASGSTEIPVDLYFACLDGNWNANGNAHFCEADASAGDGDDADFAEEVYLGRAPVSNAAAAQVFVDKVISYESVSPGANWTNRVLYASEVLFPSEYEEGMSITLDGAKYSDQMINDSITACTEMEYMRMYETDALYPRDAVLTKNALVDSLNTGHYGIFNQIGHGFYFNMSVGDDNFMTTDADALTNGDHLFALFSLNCASAAFDYSCLMERFLQNPFGGSIVSIGSSRAAFPNASNNYQQGFFDALFCTEENRVGKLVALSRLPYLPNTSFNFVDRWTFQNYTLLGDPTIPLWTGVPTPLEVSSSSLDLGPNQLSVGVNDDGGQPVANAMVCLSRDGDDFATGLTDGAGSVVLDYLASSPGAVDLRVTGKDFAQFVSSVEVLDGDTYFSFYDLGIVDDGSGGTSGNNNNSAESGETVGMNVVLQETAGTGATGLSGVLSSATSGVTVAGNTVNYLDTSGGSVAIPTSSFLVTFDPGIEDGTPVQFQLVLTDGNSDTYVVEWTVNVLAPEIEVVSVDWEDSTYGNGDGFMDIDERVVISLDIKNFGVGRADLVDIELVRTNLGATLYDTLATITNLNFTETRTVSGQFSASFNSLERKSMAQFVLTDNYGRVVQHAFYLHRPVPPLDIVTDTSLGADVIALSWAPSLDDDLHGYDIFRSESPLGPYVKVNVDAVAGVSYFRDEGLDQLTRYYYKIVTLGKSLVSSGFSATVEQSTAPAELVGFPVGFVNETSGHLAVGDIDGDGYPEVILGSDEIYVWRHNGTEFLDGDHNSQTLGPFTDLNGNFQPSGIVLAQLDDQPGSEIVAFDRGNGNKLYAYNNAGEVLPGWPQDTSYGPGDGWAWATPAAGDIDGDGDLEIVLNTLNGKTWAWHHDGTEVRDGDNDPASNGVFFDRPAAVWEWGLSAPALYDLDGDGAQDIIFGTGTDGYGAPKILAIKYDGSFVDGFPYFTSHRVNNSPAVADLNNDGIMEIVFYDYTTRLYAVQDDGTNYPGFPVVMGYGGMVAAAPCVGLGDMDEDGELEIIFAGNVNGDLSKIAIVDTDIGGGTSGQAMAGWPQSLPGSSEGSPVIGDIDGDSIPDILFGIGGGSEDAPNNLYGFKANGQSIDGFPITVTGPLMPSPVICDLDKDRDVDIVYGGWDRIVHVWDMPFSYDRMHCPWPTFRGGLKRDGVLFPTALVDVQDDGQLPPATFMAEAPYPNPFNPSTSIRLHVPDVNGAGTLELVVYDLQGRKVRTLHNGPISSGWHTLVWDGQDNSGRNQSSGLYFMRARSGQHSSLHKMTLIK
jgi:Peptidase family C25/FG-GAP-like repeat/FlgD Ig-like domain